MNTNPGSRFRKVGECLYRYSNGVYYARLKRGGKESRRSLKTTDRALAQRRLRELRDQERELDPSRRAMTLRQLCERWFETKQNGKPKTLAEKTRVNRAVRLPELTGQCSAVTNAL